jgi:hypothetical protein
MQRIVDLDATAQSENANGNAEIISGMPSGNIERSLSKLSLWESHKYSIKV